MASSREMGQRYCVNTWYAHVRSAFPLDFCSQIPLLGGKDVGSKRNMNRRKEISDYIVSMLKAEVVNRCPFCGIFEGTVEKFTNHHIL